MNTKQCTVCKTLFFTFSTKPYCIKCMKNQCCMYNTEDCDGRIRCNCTFDLHTHNGEKYCLGHFKKLQNVCNTCGTSRPESRTNFQHDYLWYCDECLRSSQKTYISTIFDSMKNLICIDLIYEIVKLAAKPVLHRYPETFNIPCEARKPLKQHI